ncbi:formate--tetrahydrofolate ligase [Myxococcota bacterium]|nr:formate--tetrahydrofolate ligase [Myxococcota bacterium]MBU1379699.1 formate--tetrahydrofolate ligase [Myxococcota bacterium]MBU1496910.1 formate--tetrahydrofolate ligase [Myxococcota bacterium]
MTDIEIANSVTPRPIVEIGEKLGFLPEDLELYGKYKAKVSADTCSKSLGCHHEGSLILVSAITPTPAGEGKTTVSIGLAQGIAKIGRSVAVALREPSLGPVMGIKGGATGGGWSQVLPMEDINLHFTGDMHAVTTAHNLLAAVLDNHIYQGNALDIDPRAVEWRRVMDMNDRSLRQMIIGLGGPTMGLPRESGFDITASSEVMATLCLVESFSELKSKLDNILIGYTYDGKPVSARSLEASGAMAALLKDAFKPNLVQTIEGVPAFIHGGPFANIAQGTNSIMATRLALKTADYTVTEAGFGFDLGAEKFFDIVARKAGFNPKAVVLVVTIRALKMHGGVKKIDLLKDNPDAVKRGLPNLAKHLENIGKFNVPAVVAINKFATDSEAEIEVVKAFCRENNVEYSVADVWGQGGEGARELAQIVTQKVDSNKGHYKPLYDLDASVHDKICAVSREIYGAQSVEYSPKAKKDLKRIERLGYDKLPICIAKTQKSLSDDPALLGRPEDFIATVREIVIAGGAGFLVPITGDILRMPGLPATPAAEKIDIDDNGNISGLF